MAVQDAPNPIIHRVSMNPGNETQKAKTKIEEIFDEREQRAAQRYSAAELEKMAIEAENETARLRGEPPKYKYRGGEEMDEEEKKKEEVKLAEQKEKLIGSARALIDSGLDPKQVGQMLLGLPSVGGVPSIPAQGMGFDEVMKIVTLVVGKKETDELKGIIASLDKKIDELAKGKTTEGKVEIPRSLTPMEYAKQQKDYIDALKDLGLIREPEPRTGDGRSLEVVKEENRHGEKMEEIKGERAYKENITEIASSIPERVGRGWAAHVVEGEGGSSGGGASSELDYITCSEKDCGAKIYITPESKGTVTCPKCGTIYQRGGAEEVKAE